MLFIYGTNYYPALVGALLLDQGFTVAEAFVRVSLLSHLPQVILEREWLTPKQKLQQVLRCMSQGTRTGTHKPVYK